MKNTIFTFLIILGISSTGLAQELKISQSELKSVFEPSNIETLYERLLYKRWEFKHVYVGLKKYPKLPDNRYFDISFKSNGRFELIEKDSLVDKGDWNYDEDKKLVYLISQNDFSANIKSIAENELIISVLSNDKNLKSPYRQIHFRPSDY